MAVADDVAASLGVPELAPPAPAPVSAPTQSAPSLPDEPGLSLITRAALAEGDQNNPDSWRGVAGVILNRMQKSGKTAAQVLSEPGQFESYANGHIQSVDPTSPEFAAAQAAIKDVTAGPYDSFFQPKIVAQRGVKPPFDPTSGTMIGSQVFGNGYKGGIEANDVASSIGLTPEEQQAFAAAHTTPPPATLGGQTQDKEGAFNVGPNAQPMTAAQAAWYKANTPAEGWSNVPTEGQQPPYALQAAGALPLTPGARYVDLDGKLHVVPGGVLEMAAGGLHGLAQGLGMDTAASASRLTGGGIVSAGDDPMLSALGALQGGISQRELAQAAQQGFAKQQADYGLQNSGNAFAQAGRFIGQAVPATAAAMAVPEIEAPAAFGGAGRVAAQGATNALRGVAATAPSVGANSAPVASQLAGGALAGVAAPLALGAPAKAVSALTGLGRTVSPEVAALADTAQSKYGIPLRSGQVMGANGDRGAATADSNLLGSSPAVRDNNIAQRQAFMKGVTGTYGDASGDVSPSALQSAKERIGGVMNDVASRNNIAPEAADALQTRISQIVGDAQDVLGDDAKPLLTMAEKVGSVRGPTGISGQSYQALTNKGAPLDRLAQSDNGNLAHYATQLRDALDDAMEISASPRDVQDFQNARWQYKNLQTVAKLAPKADVQGIISPALLRGAVGTNFKNQAFKGAGDLGELAQIGQTFMKEPANSFTPNRIADLIAPLKMGAEAAGLVGGGLALAQRPEAALGAGISALAGWGAKTASQALKQNKIGGSAAGIIQRSLPSGAPGAIGNALSGIGKVARPVEIPLSALAGVRGLNALTPAPAINAQ